MESFELTYTVAEELENLLSSLHSNMGQIKGTELQHTVTETALTLIEYKGMARDIFFGVDRCRTEIQTRKKEVDEKHLQLQNLLYEKDHLQRSMSSLRDFPMVELSKMEAEEGGTMVSGHQRTLLADEQHRTNMDSLRLERERRAELHQQHMQRQEEKRQLAEEIAVLKETLSSTIPRKIEELCSSCETVRGELQIHGVTSAYQSLSAEDLRNLPRPLYVLAGRLLSYVTASQAASRCLRVSVEDVTDKIEGSVLTTEPKSGQLDAHVPFQGHTTLPVHPRYLQLHVLDASTTQRVRFYLSKHQHKILVSTPDDPPALLYLMPGDSGRPSSHIEALPHKQHPPSPTHSRSSSNNHNDSILPRAFLWAQWLGGVFAFPAHLHHLGISYSSACILDRMRARMRQRSDFNNLLKEIQARPHSLPVDEQLCEDLFPAVAPVGNEWKLVTFVEVSVTRAVKEAFVEGMRNVDYDWVHVKGGEGQGPRQVGGEGTGMQGQESERGEGEGKEVEVVVGVGQRVEDDGGEGEEEGGELDGTSIYEAVYRRVEDRREKPQLVKLWVKITAEYPIRPPIFVMNSIYHTRKVYQNAYAQVLQEVNQHYAELVGTQVGARGWLLSHQLRKVQHCLDVLDVGNSALMGQNRLRWGKERRRAFLLDIYAKQLIPR